jgi:integrase
VNTNLDREFQPITADTAEPSRGAAEPRESRLPAFTDHALRRIDAPAAGEVVIPDPKQPGLICRITPNGVRTFTLRKRIGHRVVKIKLGRMPGMKVEDARALAREKLTAIDRGDDPRRDRTKGDTLGDVWEDFYAKRVKGKKRTAEKMKAAFDHHLGKASREPFAEFMRSDRLQTLHARIGKSAPIAANRLLALLSAVYSFKMGKSAPNPCKDVERFPEHERDRALTREELPRFLAALETYRREHCVIKSTYVRPRKPKNPDAVKPEREAGTPRENLLAMADALEVLLFTGQRAGNVLGMRWADLDLEARHWRIAAEHFKNGRSHVAVLPPAVAELLKRRRENAEEGAVYVFPTSDGSGPIPDVKRAWARVLALAEIDPESIRLHDLRGTAASMLIESGAAAPIVGRQLGHKSQHTTARYMARFGIDPIAEAVDRASDYMRNLSKREGA